LTTRLALVAGIKDDDSLLLSKRWVGMEKDNSLEVITADQFKSEIFDFDAHAEWRFEKETPIIVNFFASWCGPCQFFAPILESIAETYGSTLRVFKVDIDATPEIPALFGIRSVPTTVFIKRNEEPALAMGAISEEGMKKAIKDLLGL
jgi:thioredoxin 1